MTGSAGKESVKHGGNLSRADSQNPLHPQKHRCPADWHVSSLTRAGGALWPRDFPELRPGLLPLCVGEAGRASSLACREEAMALIQAGQTPHSLSLVWPRLWRFHLPWSANTHRNLPLLPPDGTAPGEFKVLPPLPPCTSFSVQCASQGPPILQCLWCLFPGCSQQGGLGLRGQPSSQQLRLLPATPVVAKSGFCFLPCC